jgi:hypothetical protein
VNIDDWRYADHVQEDRRLALRADGSFDALISRVVAEATVTTVYPLPGRDQGLTDCIQPIFLLDLPSTGDPLFNGPFGYRAQYWRGPEIGLAANGKLIAALAPKLLAAVDPSNSQLARIDLCHSVHAASAKLWIRESSAIEDATPDLDVQPWADRAKDGVRLAKMGLGAPEVTKFEIKGALISPEGHEVVPQRKIRRHYDIYHYGFT